MIIRKETAADIEKIAEVTIAAFNTLPISNHTEQYIINALRTADALTISLVAENNGRILGHIAFSPVTISDGSTGWYGLGPGLKDRIVDLADDGHMKNGKKVIKENVYI